MTKLVLIAITLFALITPASAQAPWTNVAYDPANFSGGTGFWSVPPTSINKNRYSLNDHTMTWSVSLSPSTVYGTTQYLAIRIPEGRVSNGTADTCAYQLIEGAGKVGIAYTFGVNGWLFLYHADTTLNWASTVGINFTCTFEVK